MDWMQKLDVGWQPFTEVLVQPFQSLGAGSLAAL